MYRLTLSNQAVKDLDRIQENLWERVQRALSELRATPRPHGCAKIRNAASTYRIRVGDYRVLYDVDDDGEAVSILRVQHRREAYRDL